MRTVTVYSKPDCHLCEEALVVLLALQADAQLAIGNPETALASVAAGLEAVERMGGGPLEAELHRLKGEALLAGTGPVGAAERLVLLQVGGTKGAVALAEVLHVVVAGAGTVVGLQRRVSGPFFGGSFEGTCSN